jgi:hypothetical protein
MLTQKEMDYVRVSFIRDVKDPEKRSKIMFVADHMAKEADKDDDYYDVYWSIIGYFLDPKHDEDLDSDFRELGGSLNSPPLDTPWSEASAGILGEPKITFKFPK